MAIPDPQLIQLMFVSSVIATISLLTVMLELAYASTVVVTLKDQTVNNACQDTMGIHCGALPVYHVSAPPRPTASATLASWTQIACQHVTTVQWVILAGTVRDA